MILSKRLSSPLIYFSLGALLLGMVPASVYAQDGAEIRGVSASKEQYERDVDAVALSSQEQSIAKLSGLLKKYKDTSQEPILLAKLAELLQQNASIIFRISHGNAHHANKALDLTRYKKESAKAIAALSTLIAKYPSYGEIAHAYFIRGKGYEELEDKKSAAKDYIFLTTHFPLAEETTAAYMSLADFAIDANEHAQAIGYLKEVEKKPDDNHYPFALYKMAWSYYNLKDIPAALKYAEKQIHYYDDLVKNAPEGEAGLTSSDNALRENTLLDSAVFYFEGYEENPKTYDIGHAYDYFRNLEKGPIIGKMLYRYSKLLRAHAHDHDLVEWKNRVLKAELSGDLKAPETLDIILNTYEHMLNRREYAAVTATAQDIVSLYSFSKKNNRAYGSFDRAQKELSDTADGWQQLIVKNKDADEAKDLSRHLAALYDAFTRIMDDNDPRVPGAHYNLAETQFTIKDYDGATQNYRWIVEHGKWKKNTNKIKDKNTVSVFDASLKAIASRYEVLEAKNLLPKDVKAVSIGENSEAKLDPLFGEWIAWIDTHLEHSEVGTENFQFEANRSLYHHGHILEALKRLNSFAEDHPKSDYAIPSASLVLDTLIATGDWHELLKKAEEYMNIDEWKKSPFNKRLYTASADASYKMIEVHSHAKSDDKSPEKNYADTLSLADDFLKKYKNSDRFSDTLVLAGAVAMQAKKPELALQYFTRLINDAPKSAAIRDALLARAAIEEGRYDTASASRDYNLYLKLPNTIPNTSQNASKDPKNETEQRVALEKKILAYMFINANWADLKASLDSKDVCSKDVFDGELLHECDRYRALGALLKPELFKSDVDTAFDHARKDEGELAAIWAAVSLEGAKQLAFRDRLLAIRHFAKNWDELDPLVKFAVLPYVNTSIPHALALNRKMMDEVAPLRMTSDAEKYITHRVDIMREMENAVTLAMKLPWARIKADSLNELAATYLDFSTTLAALQPKGLKDAEVAVYQETIRKITVPFDEKGQDLRSKAFQLASRYAIEDASFQAIAQPFFADNPSQAKALRKVASVTGAMAGSPGLVKGSLQNTTAVASAMELDLNFLDLVDPSEHWKKLVSDRTFKPNERVNEDIQHFFLDALTTKNYQKMAFFLQEAKAKNAFPPYILSAMKSVSLTTAGARAEALLEIEDSRQNWDPKAKLIVLGVLSRHYEQSYAIDRAQVFEKEIEIELTPKTQVSSSN
jgi:TolA-binding protein